MKHILSLVILMLVSLQAQSYPRDRDFNRGDVDRDIPRNTNINRNAVNPGDFRDNNYHFNYQRYNGPGGVYVGHGYYLVGNRYWYNGVYYSNCAWVGGYYDNSGAWIPGETVCQ